MTKYAGRAPYPFTPGENTTGQCSDCGEVFVGERAFAKHWHGDGHDTPRHCIPPERDENPKARWRLDDRGRWHWGDAMAPEVKDRIVARAESRVGANPPPRAGAGVSGTPRPARRPETRESEGAA